MAELATITHQVRTANNFSRAAVRRELAATVDRLGLRDGMLGAEQRMATLPTEVRAALADVTNQASSQPSERSRLRPDRRTAEAEGRPVGLPRMRTYLGTHFTVNSLLLGLATTFTLTAGGRPELALMLGAGAFVGAVTTGPAKWLAKRAGLAAEDRRARYDARQEARTAAEEDATTAAALAAGTADVTSAAQELGTAATGLDGQVSAVQEQLRRDEHRYRFRGSARQFPPASKDAAAVADDSPGTGTTSAGVPGGSTDAGLTPREQERLAELRGLAARHDGARPWARFGTGREIRAVLDSLGLRQGTPGVEQRRDLVPADVRPLVDRFGDSRTAAVQDRVRAAVDRYPADGQRPSVVAPWWSSMVENVPNLLTAATVAGVGNVLGELRLGWFGIAGALAAAASGVAVDPVVARREATARDARDSWDTDNPAMPAAALLSQAAEAVADPISAVTDRAATAVRRTTELEQRLADLERRVADSQRRSGLVGSFRRLLFGDPAWAGLPASKDANARSTGANPESTGATSESRVSTGSETPTVPGAAASVDPRGRASLQLLAELAVRHESVGPLARLSVARQLRILVDQLGLREGTPGADQRREQVPAELRPAVERHGRLSVTSRAIERFSSPPPSATDSAQRPSDVRSLRVRAVEQTLGPLVQGGAWVGAAKAAQVAAGAAPSKILAGGLLGPLRTLLLDRAEARVRDALRAWDLANPNPAMEPQARVARLADPSATAVTNAAGQLDVTSRRLEEINAALGRLAHESTPAAEPAVGPADPVAIPGTGETLDVAVPVSLSRADAWELQTAAHQVQTADTLSLRPALRELHAVIDRLGLRAGMLGAPDRIAQLPDAARQVVTEFGGDRAGRGRQLRTLRAGRQTAENARPPGVPRLRTYLVSSALTTAATAGAATAVAIAVASPLAPVIPIAAAVAAPVVGAARWHALRQGLAIDDRRSRFDARVNARDAADQVDQVVDRLNEPLAGLGQAANRLEGQLSAAEAATDQLTERLAETHRRVGLLARLFDIVGWGSAARTGTHPETGAVRENNGSPAGSPDSGRITAAAVPNSDFHGLGRPVADPAAVLATAQAALPRVGPYAGVDYIGQTGPSRFEIYAAGRFSFRVLLTAGPLADGVVAQTTRNSDGSFTVTVSDRAVDRVVTRALAHEIAELAALYDSRQIYAGPLDPGNVDGLIDPAGLTAHDHGRMAEVRLLAAEYESADAGTRLALRTEIDALADHLGLRAGDPAAPARWAVLPRDVGAQLMRLSAASVTQESVAKVVRGIPATEVEKYRWIDYRARLAPDFQVPSSTELQAQLHELMLQGEQEQASLPRMPAYAGQIIDLPPAQLSLIRDVDPKLADRIAAEGIYVNLVGRFDVRPYVLAHAPEFSLADSRSAFDLGAEAGRQSLLAEDRTRSYVAIRANFGARPAAMAQLNANELHYMTNARALALVPGVLARALHALVPGAPPLDLEVTPTATAGEVTVIADRVALPAEEPGEPAPEYGRARDVRTGQPAPLFDGPPKREQVRQGVLGDCGMLASMAAVAGHRPEAIAQLFQPNPDGTVDVLLHESTLLGDSIEPTGRRLRITVHPDVPIWDPVSGESAYADQSMNGSSWAALLEKALAAVDRTWSVERHLQWQRTWAGWESPNDPLVAAPTGYARLNVGSHRQMQAELLTQLTGVASHVASFDPTPGREAAVEARLEALLAARSPVLTATFGEDHYPVAIRDQLPHGLVPGHAYEVVAAGDGLVQLRNPWNVDHPTPMTVREFLDLMSEDFAYLEPPQSPPTPPTASVQFSHPHTLGQTVVEELGYAIAYYALFAGDGTVIGLAVSESSAGRERTRRWTAPGAQSAAGSALPVSRAEAERIASEVLGFTLPDEAALHDMLEG
ncbi:calpain family cysteine peptidase [Salinispora oceanensis]|uniref:C2 family cysteine protease n=1 Tax=Salinispora oceanensis TaxID=1050199 RepID=UPI000361F9A7|nr:C2 family cysteine protease [Salinispora oceanensis]